MEGNSKIIKFISRDENLHVAITQNIMKNWINNPDEGFQDIVKKNEDKVYAAYEMAASELIDEAATERAGEMLARSLNAGDFIGIDGELGAGKTSFVRGLARGLAIDSQLVASPTFVTMQSYEGRRCFVHY